MKNKGAVSRKRTPAVLYSVCGVLFLICFILIPLADWFSSTFGVGIEAMLYTARAPMVGADTHFLAGALKKCVPWALCSVVLSIILAWADIKFISKYEIVATVRIGSSAAHRIDILRLYRRLLLIFCIFLSGFCFLYANRQIRLIEYLKASKTPTSIYDNYYVDPKNIRISYADRPKNLIYLYMESMENTYASEDAGGKQPLNNYIPNLCTEASQNISFSDGGKLGGFHCPAGAGWTMGAIFATTTGIPFAFPVEGNSMNQREKFASGVTSLGDVLQKKGYRQEFLCGSDGEFAGRTEYFAQHGGYTVFDYNTAIKRNYIAADYHVWWGFEDEILYRIAEDEILRLAADGQPFNFTFLTADTHHVGGYVCKLCKNTYPEQLANVVVCADEQAEQFLAWCRKQSFFKDTVIIITGDHPRMDTLLVKDVDYYDRTVYNCFINSSIPGGKPAIKNRNFTSMDMFPTILAAMGFSIEGDRLGLGTNLFSGRKTLTEQLGFDYVNGEIGKYSKYYMTHFP